MPNWLQISICRARLLRGLERPLAVAGVLIALLYLVGMNIGLPSSARADEPAGWATTTLASSSVWLTLSRDVNFIEFNLDIQMETESCHRIADAGEMERPTSQQFLIDLVIERRTNPEICSGQEPKLRSNHYGRRYVEPGSYEFVVKANGDVTRQWALSVISEDRGACIADANKDFHLDRIEVVDFVTAHLLPMPIVGFGIPTAKQAIDALTHYMLYGHHTPPTLVCQNATMPRWKAPMKFIPPKYEHIAHDLTVITRTLEATSSAEVIDVSMTIVGYDANDHWEQDAEASATTCGSTRPDYTERCWEAEFKDIPDNRSFIDQKFHVTINSNQIASGQSGIFIVEPKGRNSGAFGVGSGQHIIISQDPPVNAAVAIEYDVLSVDILSLSDDDSQDSGVNRHSSVGQAYFQARFEAHEIAAATSLALSYRMPDSDDRGSEEMPIEVIVNGQVLDHSLGTTQAADDAGTRETIDWPIAYLLQEGENVVEIHFGDAGASGYQLERLEITR